MKALISHIDSLILEHDCVIIPDFGGFVLNRESAVVDENSGAVMPPKLAVGFNPELKHSDGLLAESYMNVMSVSYDVACKLISDEVKELNACLALRQSILVGKLGVLSLNDKSNVVFAPRSIFYHPSVFGFSPVAVKRLSELAFIEEIAHRSARRFAYKRLLGGVAAAAAAILIFFVTSTPITQHSTESLQKAGFFTAISAPSLNGTTVLKKIEPKVDTKALITPTIATPTVESVATKVATLPTQETKKSVSQPYHIIVASTLKEDKAREMLSKMESQGFVHATVLSSADRYRVSVASFADKDKANRFLVNLRKNGHEYTDAWLFSN